MPNVAEFSKSHGVAGERFRPVSAPMAMPEQVLVREGGLRALALSMFRPFLFQR